MVQQITIAAWLFPGAPACSAMQEIADGRVINTLKPQYYRLSNAGILIELDASDPTVGCNGYSIANAAAIKAHSTTQFVTISASIAGVVALATSATLLTAATKQLTAFLAMTQFTGIELDAEGFSSWTANQYAAYQSVVTSLGNTLHAAGYQLMLDGPAISNATYQGYYRVWRWEDCNALPVDFLTVMAYDEQADQGAGTPVASFSWLSSICQWMLAKISDHSRIVVGIPSYGYHAPVNTYTVTEDTYQQSKLLPGFSTAVRDPSSGEMTWQQNKIAYDYSDSTSLDLKLQTVLNAGISNVSVWALGGNEWFSQPVPAPIDPLLVAFTQKYPRFDAWYKANLS